MRIPNHFVSAITACFFLTSCSTVRVQKDLACRFAELKESGKIPGLRPDSHGQFQTEGTRFGDRITYPLSQTIYLTTQEDLAQYAYTFIKDTSVSEWQLTAAWRTLPDGRRENLKIEPHESSTVKGDAVPTTPQGASAR